jgi:hypothetical protein
MKNKGQEVVRGSKEDLTTKCSISKQKKDISGTAGKI